MKRKDKEKKKSQTNLDLEDLRERFDTVLKILKMDKNCFNDKARYFEEDYRAKNKIKDKENQKSRYTSDDDLIRIFSREDNEISKGVMDRFFNTVEQIISEKRDSATPYSEEDIRKIENHIVGITIHILYKEGNAEISHYDYNDMKKEIEKGLSKTELHILDKYFDGFVMIARILDGAPYALLRYLTAPEQKFYFLESLLMKLKKSDTAFNQSDMERVRELFNVICAINFYKEIRSEKDGSKKDYICSIEKKIFEYNKKAEKAVYNDFTSVYDVFKICLDPLNLIYIVLLIVNPDEERLSVTI